MNFLIYLNANSSLFTISALMMANIITHVAILGVYIRIAGYFADISGNISK